MNTSEFLITRGRDSLGKGRKGDSSMFARMFTIEGRREQLDEFARAGEEKVLPALQRFDGFEGLLVLANRQNGKILIVTLWQSEEAMRSGEEASYWFRAFSAEAAGGEVSNVERYEVVFSEKRGAQHQPGFGIFAPWEDDGDDCHQAWYRDTANP
jgi:heme-degrading monooxygenase HmoA